MLFERAGSTRPKLPCCPVGVITPGHMKVVFSHFLVPLFQSADHSLSILLENQPAAGL